MKNRHYKLKGYIVTIDDNTNYGNVIQSYALQNFLLEKGYYFEIAKLPIEEIKDEKLKQRKKNKNNINKFIKKNLIISQKPKKYFEESNSNFIIGSDQVWRGWLRDYFDLFFLNFKTTNKKIAYAASLGVSKIKETSLTKEEIKILPKLLENFNAIGIRERQGVKLLEKEFNIKAEHTIDPVFFLKKNDYIEKFKLKNKKKYQKELLFFLEENDYIETIRNSSNKTINITTKESVKTFLTKIYNSKIVFTDSFHVVCLSIIFKKNFFYTANNRGVTRIIDLLEMLEIKNRELTELNVKNPLTEEKIDYENLEKILEKKIADSKMFLINTLNEK